MRKGLTFFCLIWSVFSSGQDTLTVDKLDYRFVTYEKGILAPLSSLETTDVAGLFISCPDYDQIEFCGIRPFSIWINGQLIAESKTENCVYLMREMLCQLAGEEKAYLSVVSETGLAGISGRAISAVNLIEQPDPELLIRNFTNAHWILGFLFGTVLLVISQIVRPRNRWRFQKPNLKEFSQRFLTLENVSLIALLAMVNAFCYSYLLENTELFFLIKSATLILSVWFGKTALILLSGTIFKQWRWANWQLNFQLLFWLIASLIGFGILFLDFVISENSKLSFEVVSKAGVFASLTLLFLITLVFMSQKGLKNLYIFIYLCTTEILPTALLVYFFLEKS